MEFAHTCDRLLLCPPTWGSFSLPVTSRANCLSQHVGDTSRIGGMGFRVESPDIHSPDTQHLTDCDMFWYVTAGVMFVHVCECRIWSFTPKVVQNVHTVDIIIYGDATSALFFTDMDMYINLCFCVCVCVCSRQMSCSKYCTLSGAQKNVEVLASCDFHPKVWKTTATEECGVFGCNLLFFFLLSVFSVNHMRAEWTGITGAMRTHLSCDRAGKNTN